MSPRLNDSVEDAIERLVFAMVGNDDASILLARRIVSSQFGSSQDETSASHLSSQATDLSSSWRRISRRSPNGSCRADVESLYRRLEYQLPREEQSVPSKLLLVLTKLMGKHLVLKPPTQAIPSPDKHISSADARVRSVQRHVPRNHTFSTRQERNPYQLAEERKELETEEALLLRECLYSLQGIDGDRIRYYQHSGTKMDPLLLYDGVRVRSPALSHSLLYSGRVLETRLGSGATDALRVNGEAGWLYCQLQSYIHQVQQDESKGVVARAFVGTLGSELREYHSLLTQYESQLPNLTLRQLLVDLQRPMSRLRILALVADGVRHLSGGHLLTALYQHALHGDTRHAKLIQKILCSASRPWFDILYTWTTQGILSDPHGEFFVTADDTVDDKYLWNEKYNINKDQIPEGILSKDLVGPAFNVGKGINFIRRCLMDGKWSMNLDSSASAFGDETTQDTDLGYSYHPDTDGNEVLRHTLSRAAALVHSHILRTLREDCHLSQHLFALKQFLFLGQGDFFSALMDGLHSEFREQPGVAGVFKHTLLAIVEGALRSTNAKYLQPYVLDRLQVELLLDPDDEAYGMFGSDEHNKGSDKRTVWDIFMLDYQVPDPLLAIIQPHVLEMYKGVFSLLFRLRRVEFMLNYTWRQSATLQHSLQTYGQYNGVDINSNQAYAQAIFLLRKISILRQNMMHLIVNLKSYFMFEVLEGGWRRLESEIDEATTLDEVIHSHNRYMKGIIRKSLMETENEQDEVQRKLSHQVQVLLGVATEFCDLQERLFHESLVLAEVASQKRIEANQRASQGRWGFDSEQDITEEEKFFGLADSNIMRDVSQMARVYNDNALELLRALSEKVNENPDNPDDNWGENDESDYDDFSRKTWSLQAQDQDLDSQRFLIAQLDHNDFYGSQGLRG